MKSDAIALAGIIFLALIYSVNQKIGGVLIAIVVLGMLLKLNSVKG